MAKSTIVFVTTNKGKIASLREKLDRSGLTHVKIDAQALDIIEPQADTCEEVARSKARQAYELLHQPLLVDDSSFHITALGGFPGVYAKYMNDKLGAQGIIDFMEHKDDRSAYFDGVLVYVDARGQEHIFHEDLYKGQIAPIVHDISDMAPWSDLHKIFIPDGSTRVLGNMTRDDYDRTERTSRNKYTLFVEWLKRNEQV